MASLDSLPADQRAVLELVLRQGRSYDDIARLLSIDCAGVRQRALAAFDLLGPQTQVPAQRRALIADYLLGQLPARVSEEVRERLAASPSERAWARVVASELGQVAGHPLPEIPVGVAGEHRTEPPPLAEGAGAADEGSATGGPRPSSEPDSAPAARPSSRIGGAVLLGLGALVVVAVVIVLVVVVADGSSSKHSSHAAATTSSPATSAATATTATTPKVLAQLTLTPPAGSGTPKGVAQVVSQGTVTAIVIVASGMPPNSRHDAYAVWLSNSPTDNYRLGFVNPGVGNDGRLQTAGGLPPTARNYKLLLVTLETQPHPRAPGKVVLTGPFRES